MDGKGRYRDNMVIKWLWRSLQCEFVCLRELEKGLGAHQVSGVRMSCIAENGKKFLVFQQVM